MKHSVVRPFIDKKSGNRIEPGDPLPKGMTEDRLRRLIRIGCVEGPLPREKNGDGEGAGKNGKGSRSAAGPQSGAAADSEGKAGELFPDAGAPVAGGAGDADSGRAELEPGGRGDGPGEDEGHRGQ